MSIETPESIVRIVNTEVLIVVIKKYTPLLAFGLLWQLAGVIGLLPYFIPAPSGIIAELVALYQAGDLIVNIIASLQIVYTGYLGAAFMGIIVGLVSGRNELFGRLFDPLVSLTYPVPKIALFPLFIIWFGLGFNSKVAVIFLAAFYTIYINAVTGARNVDRQHVWSARNFNASRFRILRSVVLPESLPHIFSGLRVGLALGFIVVFAAELISSQQGLGHLIILAQQGQNFRLMFAGILTIALLGFLHDRLLVHLRSRLIVWGDVDEF